MLDIMKCYFLLAEARSRKYFLTHPWDLIMERANLFDNGRIYIHMYDLLNKAKLAADDCTYSI